MKTRTDIPSVCKSHKTKGHVLVERSRLDQPRWNIGREGYRALAHFEESLSRLGRLEGLVVLSVLRIACGGVALHDVSVCLRDGIKVEIVVGPSKKDFVVVATRIVVNGDVVKNTGNHATLTVRLAVICNKADITCAQCVELFTGDTVGEADVPSSCER
jgi:hypothetical protein